MLQVSFMVHESSEWSNRRDHIETASILHTCASNLRDATLECRITALQS